MPTPFHRILARLHCCALLLAIATLTACSDSIPQLHALPAEAVILSFGDSLTFGTGAPPGQSYPDQLARLSARRVVNGGVPGELSAQGVARLPSLLDAHQPDLLVLCHGGNDILRGLPTSQIQRNLSLMVQAAMQRNIDVILIGVPERSLLLRTAPLYEDVAQQNNVALEDDILVQVLGEKSLRSDRIHPNQHGYGRIAQAVYGLLQASGALP